LTWMEQFTWEMSFYRVDYSLKLAKYRLEIPTVLVLSGETNIEDLVSAPNQPDLVCENLGDLLLHLKDILENGFDSRKVIIVNLC